MLSTHRHARTHIRMISRMYTYMCIHIQTRMPSCNGARTYARTHTHEHTVCIYHILVRALLRQHVSVLLQSRAIKYCTSKSIVILQHARLVRYMLPNTDCKVIFRRIPLHIPRLHVRPLSVIDSIC